MSFSAVDHAHMALALRLAERGMYTTKPNPMVGCVIAHGHEIVGKGFHLRKGGPHAEVHALREAGAHAQGATAYVTLEPCAHSGSTPPCTDALIGAGISRVVVATRDPFPQVDGQGLARLRAAGISVELSLMESAARELNRGFFSRIERQRPWLRVKLAMSLDGRTALADGESKWITSTAARSDVQRWRARCGALLTGIGTVIADNPRLTVRLGDDTAVVPPLRAIVDARLSTPPHSRVLDNSAPSLVFHAADVVLTMARDHADYQIVTQRNGRLDLAEVLTELARRGVNEAQVEAGARLSGALLREGLVDELLLYVAPILLGACGRPLFSGVAPGSMLERFGFRMMDLRHVGSDVRMLLRPESNRFRPHERQAE